MFEQQNSISDPKVLHVCLINYVFGVAISLTPHVFMWRHSQAAMGRRCLFWDVWHEDRKKGRSLHLRTLSHLKALRVKLVKLVIMPRDDWSAGKEGGRI